MTSTMLTCLQDGEVSGDEFRKAIQNNCMGKSYNDLPKAFKAFIDGYFKTVDIDGNLGAAGKKKLNRQNTLFTTQLFCRARSVFQLLF